MALIWISVISSFLMLVVMYIRYQFRDPLILIAGFYFYFAYGPVISYLLGKPIYAGIIVEQISVATLIFLLGMSSIFLISIIIKPRLDVVTNNKYNYFALNILMITLILYTTYMIGVFGIRTIGQNKIVKLAQINGFLHYNYLLLQMFVAAFFFSVKDHKATSQIFVINFILYILYCLVFSERDFIFVLVSIIIYRQSSKTMMSSYLSQVKLTIMLPIGAVILGTFLFSLRSELNLSEQFLNQGSILFVNTRVLEWTDTTQQFLYGETYINSILNLLPRQIYSTGFYLLDWFKNNYAPSSNSGYGFALDAEAYLNFGFLGVPLLFCGVSFIHRSIFNRRGTSPFFMYFSVFFTITLMSALRNDSLQLIKSSLYALFFFGAIVIVSNPARKKVFLRQQDPISETATID